jgi:signal transduction histidine kinase
LSRLIQLKQLPKLASVPVILLAPAGWEPDFVTQAFELGAADVVQEPWVAEQLTTRLSALWKVHELQTALQEQAQKTRRVRDELESFMMAASHDLQGPLRKALRFSEFIKASQGQTYRTQKDAKMLEGLERSLSQMQDLLSGLLALSRVKVRGNPFGLVDLAGIAQTITHEKNLQPGILEARNLPMIEGDAAQLKQLLEALIENALKFQPAGNTPVVRLDGYVDVASGTCKVIVSDNGIGFPEEEAEAIFQPFKRLHGVGKYPGAGLGLSLARKIAERHGGTLQAKAEPGSGANFILSLPSRQLFPE